MEMLVIIAAILFLLKIPEVSEGYFHTNNLVRKSDHHSTSEEFLRHKEEYEKIDEKWDLGRIGQEVSIMRSQMRSVLQMIELQAVDLQNLRDKAITPSPIVQTDITWKNHILIGRRYWRKIRKELRSIRECSCRPTRSTVSDAVVESGKSEVFQNITTEKRIFLETDEKDISSSSGGGGGSDRVDDGNINTHETGRNLGSSDVFEPPNSTDKSNQSMTKVTSTETNQLPNPTTENPESKREKNKTIPFNPSTSVDDTLESYDVEIDLTSGIVHGKLAPGLTWLLHPSWPKKRKSDWTSQCALQSVLKLSFSPPKRNVQDLGPRKTGLERRKLLIDLWFQKPHKWIFNLGDSSSNDGLSGDGSTQENDCEAEGYGDTFNVYKSDKARDPFKKILYQKKGFLKHRVTFIVSDQSLFWNNHDGIINILNDSTLFALNDQPDSQGQVNSDIYLALNRVISGDYRNGHGLCRAALKWLL